jgi:hypothetical protein
MTARNKYILGTIIGALATIWIIAMIALFPLFRQARAETRLVQQTMEEYTSAMIAGRFDEAYNFCDAEYRDATPYEQFLQHQQFLQQKHGKLLSVKRVWYRVQGSGEPARWNAEGNWEFRYERQTLELKFALHKESDRWVIFGSVEP